MPSEGTRPTLLDLFCGAGGAAMGYHRAGFEVVGVDIEPQPNYPFEFIQDDALDVLLRFNPNVFDAIHASPPCQAYSLVTPDPSRHPQLIGPVRDLLDQTGLPYVIENVMLAPLRNPVQVCGSGLGLDVQRHRAFEMNFSAMGVPCAHGGRPAKFDVYEHGRWYKSPFVKVYGSGGGKAMEHWAEAMGIDWMTPKELAEAIPPAYTAHIGYYLMEHLRHEREAPNNTLRSETVQ